VKPDAAVELSFQDRLAIRHLSSGHPLRWLRAGDCIQNTGSRRSSLMHKMPLSGMPHIHEIARVI
jgi:hypothetical protein